MNIQITRMVLFFLFIVSLCGCGDDDSVPIDEVQSSPNILFIIADDMGKDATNGYSEGSTKPNTPNLNRLMSDGLRFSNLWVNPICSPTRASILTGKYGYRTGVKAVNDQLDQSEKVLHQFIKEETDLSYATALVGKWHLSGGNETFDPEVFGIDYYAGLLRGGVQDYYNWQLSEDGVGTLQTDYSSQVFTDLSMNWIADQTKPWFLWLAYNAPHTPFHLPPSEMHSQGALPPYTGNEESLPYYIAAIEAMDYQIGRLISSLEAEEAENTVIVFIGDNGTPGQVAQNPFSRITSKGSLYQGGINVPMFISGPGVDRRGEDSNLICGTDLFATISELAGINQTEINDSKSFKSLLTESSSHRNFQYSEMGNGTESSWAISNGSYKLILDALGSEELYDLSSDSYERSNLIEEQLTDEAASAKLALEAELAVIRN